MEPNNTNSKQLEKLVFNEQFLTDIKLTNPIKVNVHLIEKAKRHAIRLSTYVWSEKLVDKNVELVVKYPATWWDAFKERFFDCDTHWFWKKHKPKYKIVKRTYNFKSYSKYPTILFNDYNHEGIIYEMITYNDYISING